MSDCSHCGLPQPTYTPPPSLGEPPMQLSVCAQFISFAAELFPTAANNTASLCHLLQQAAAPVYPVVVELQRVAVCRYLCTGGGSAGYLLAALVLLCPVCAALALPLLVFLHLLHIAAACRRYCWPANTLFRLIYWLAAAASGQRSCHTVLQGRAERQQQLLHNVYMAARRGGRECGLSACLSAATTTTIIHGPLYGWPSTYRQMKCLASAGHKLMKVKLKFLWWGPARPGLASLNSTRMLSAMPQSLVARTHLRTNGHTHTHTSAGVYPH